MRRVIFEFHRSGGGTPALSYMPCPAVWTARATWGIDMGDTGEARFRYRHDGWTPARQMAFLRALRETACVRTACKHVGLTSTSAYRVKQRIPDFGAAWDAALAYRMPALERAAYQRAVEGWLEPIVYKGEVVGQRRRFSDAMLRLLLQREDARAAPGRARVATAASAAMSRAAAEAELLKRLKAFDKRKRMRAPE
jgi:hypothetical protein